MRILSIVWYKVLPAIYGGQKGTALFNKYLSAHASLSCLCSKDNHGTELPYQLIPKLPIGKNQFLDPRCWSLISRTAKEQNSTHLILEHPYHGIGAVRAMKSSRAALIVHSHNIESERFREMGKPGWKVLAHYEKWVHRNAQLSLFKTEKDQNFAIRHFGLSENSCMVIPFGVEIGAFSSTENEKSDFIREKFQINPEEKIFLFAGTLDYLPNAKAVTAIFEHIAPALVKLGIPFRIIICGRLRFPSFQYLKKLQHPHVHLEIEADNLEPYYSLADAFINPVSDGGGIQTKNIEALARNCTVVGFENMMDSSITKHAGKKVLKVKQDDWQGFARAIVSATENQESTPDEFFLHFNWHRITAELTDRLSRL